VLHEEVSPPRHFFYAHESLRFITGIELILSRDVELGFAPKGAMPEF